MEEATDKWFLENLPPEALIEDVNYNVGLGAKDDGVINNPDSNSRRNIRVSTVNNQSLFSEVLNNKPDAANIMAERGKKGSTKKMTVSYGDAKLIQKEMQKKSSVMNKVTPSFDYTQNTDGDNTATGLADPNSSKAMINKDVENLKSSEKPYLMPLQRIRSENSIKKKFS